jgi:hypothetical protein
MTFVPAPNCARVTLLGKLNGQDCQNVFDYQKIDPGPITAALLDTLAQDVYEIWQQGVVQNVSQEYVISGAKAIDLGEQFGAFGQYTTTQAAGAATSPAAGNGTTFCIKLTTPLRGRSYRGRKYIGGIATQDVDNGLVSTTRANALLSGVGALNSLTNVPGWQLCIVSYSNNNTPRTVAASTPVTGVSYSTLATTSQRRRNVGQGS